MNKKLMMIGLVVGLVVWGLIKYHTSSSNMKPDAISVQTAQVQEVSLPLEVHVIGSLVANSVEITPEIAGHVDQVLFQDGAIVKKGDPLIQLDDAVYRAKYASTMAQLSYSENNFKRMTLLGKQGAIAKQAIDQADADLKEKRASAQESEVMVNKMKLVAPFDGVVGKSKVTRGDYVTIGQALVTLTNTQHLHIEYNIPEKYVSFLKIGEVVNITTADYPGKTFTGQVAFISPTINPDSRTISVYAEISNKQNWLASGMFVDVTQSLGTENHALMIPARALVPVLDGEQVFKVVDGKAYAVTIVIGKRTQNRVQVLEGLSQGDRIVTDGQLKLKNGAVVK